MTDTPGGGTPALTAQLQADLAALDGELAEIQLLVGQARSEAQRHEQKREQAEQKLAKPGRMSADEKIEAYRTLVTLTRRATLMEAQVEILEGKQKALARYRAAMEAVAKRLSGLPAGDLVPWVETTSPGEADSEQGDTSTRELPAGAHLPPSASRLVLSAQEDLRREIARAMHDGPAQSLTNIVLQAQIVDLLIDRDPAYAKGEVRLLVSMVQQTLDATKNFIFDVRPMVLDDLGLVPTLRRATRERGRRARIPVEFESVGQDRRLPVDVESAAFRILDEGLSAYLAQSPERVQLRLDWGEVLEARLTAHRSAVVPLEAQKEVERLEGDVPDALRAMVQDREDKRQAVVAAAEEAAIVALPPAIRRDALARAASIEATVEILAGGGELRLVVPLPPSEDAGTDA